MPRKKKAAPAADAAVSANPPPPPADKPAKAKAGVSIAERFHEPYNAQVWDVSYSIPGREEPLVDANFRSLVAAESHADAMREHYGL